jgi:hypothetical protein
MSSIDPNVPGIFFGEVLRADVIDPSSTIPGLAIGNLVIDPSKPFTVEVEWYIDGPFAPAMKVAMGSSWQLRIVAESQGPGPEPVVANVPVAVASGVDAGTRTTWTHSHTVPAGTFQEGLVFKLLAVVRDVLPGPVDVAGYAEGPVILTERP